MENSTDILGRLAAEAEEDREREFPPTWNRDTEPQLYGTLVEDREVETKYGTRRVATLRRPDETTVDVWITPFKLREEWEFAAPQVGDFLLVSYHGDIATGKSNPMADIRVRVDRDQAEFEPASDSGDEDDTPF